MRFRFSGRLTAASVLAILSLQACATGPGSKTIGVIPSDLTGPQGMDPIATAAYWGTRYDRNPSDPQTAVAYSTALRAMGNHPEALRVMQQTAMRVETNPDVMLELGKALLANDRPFEAVRPIERALASGKSEDWTAFSAYGVALDQTGEHRLARQQYDRALSLSPDNPVVLNNKGLSYALDRRHGRAQTTLRTAAAAPGGSSRVRQNLALVLALSGNTTEAERLARADLPPTIADRNVAYYRSLIAQPVYWEGFDSEATVQPNFGDDPDMSTTPISEPVPEPKPSPSRWRFRRNQTPKPAPQDDQRDEQNQEEAPATQGVAAVSTEAEPRTSLSSLMPVVVETAQPSDGSE